MKKEYGIKLNEKELCPKCGFNGLVAIGEDTVECGQCKYIGSADEFYRVDIVPQGTEKCPVCGTNGEIVLDEISKDGRFICKCKCGHVAEIEAFIGEETWSEFVAKEKSKMGVK